MALREGSDRKIRGKPDMRNSCSRLGDVESARAVCSSRRARTRCRVVEIGQ